MSDLLAPGLPDLAGEPFTLPRSRLLVMRGEVEDSLSVFTAEYERPVTECVVIDRLRVRTAAGSTLPISSVSPDRISWGDGAITLTFAGPHALSVGSTGGERWVLEVVAPARVGPSGWSADLPHAGRVTWLTTAGVTVDRHGPTTPVFTVDGAGSVLITAEPVGRAPVVRPDHPAHLAATSATWRAWFDRCPPVRPDLRAMAQRCWWTLGANLVELDGYGEAPVVVPSKLGYVGLWQWDTYFIAIGLRHGALDLARQQIDLALSRPSAEGQLPDVLFDGAGVLASSADLPAADLAALRRVGGGAADLAAEVPLTKPPLTAWAAHAVDRSDPDPGWLARTMATVARSQEWWFAQPDTERDGVPGWGHPYSSGLDDNPIFDGGLPVLSPDLAAYLIVQDDLLAAEASERGMPDAEARYRERSARSLERLEQMWDPPSQLYRASVSGIVTPSVTAVSLLPLLTGRLKPERSHALQAALNDPQRFGAPWGVPSVALDDTAFDPEVMWRGPSWMNIGALMVGGLDASGFGEDGDELAERLLEMVECAGGPVEYVNPLTGGRPARATTSFSWTAALYIDLAVRVSSF